MFFGSQTEGSVIQPPIRPLDETDVVGSSLLETIVPPTAAALTEWQARLQPGEFGPRSCPKTVWGTTEVKEIY